MFKLRKNSLLRNSTFRNILLIIGMLFIFTRIADMRKDYGDEGFRVHFIDIGQGDAVLIQTPEDEFMLIDSGEYEYNDKLAKYLRDLDVKAFKYVIFTHPHSDHIGSAAYIVGNYDIETLIMPNAVNVTRAFSNLLDAIEARNLEVTRPVIGDEYILGGAKFMIAAPITEYHDNLNNHSVAIKMIYRETSYFFSGDIERVVENEIIARCKETNSDLSSDVLKIAHHGSNSSSSAAFLDLINPRIAVIFCGINNLYNHPHKDVLQRLEDRDISVVRTDLEGDVVISTNGRGYTIRTQNHGRISEDTE